VRGSGAKRPVGNSEVLLDRAEAHPQFLGHLPLRQSVDPVAAESRGRARSQAIECLRNQTGMLKGDDVPFDRGRVGNARLRAAAAFAPIAVALFRLFQRAVAVDHQRVRRAKDVRQRRCNRPIIGGRNLQPQVVQQVRGGGPGAARSEKSKQPFPILEKDCLNTTFGRTLRQQISTPGKGAA
jgi:hypothetical protein